jgi:hypothetical protein
MALTATAAELLLVLSVMAAAWAGFRQLIQEETVKQFDSWL